MIEFREIRIEGFASIKSEVFQWDNPGLNIIQAPNGSGKTKFISALSWVLFGKTLGGSVEPWDFVKDEDYQGTKVEQDLIVGDDELEIIRCKDYRKNVQGAKGKNRLVVLINGELLDKILYQRCLIIIKLLKLNTTPSIYHSANRHITLF